MQHMQIADIPPGRSGLVVSVSTVVLEKPGSNLTTNGLFIAMATAICSLGHELCLTSTAVPRSTQSCLLSGSLKRAGPILRNFSGCTISKVHV